VLRVPLPLAALHQAGAVVVFTCALGLARVLRPASLQR
jgi:heme A synthase